MTKPQDSRESAPEQAAADTREPDEAARIRAADDAETRKRQDETDSALRAAAGTLEENEARLRETENELRARERELSRTAELTGEVGKRVEDLRAGTDQTSKAARKIQPR